MDLETSAFTIVVPLLIFIFILALISKQRNRAPWKNLPPGPWKLPLIGNLHLLSCTSQPPHRTLTNLASKYGPLMHVQLGEVSTIVVSSAESAKHFLKTHDITFASRPSLLSVEALGDGITDMAFAPYGKYWRQLRKICTLELLSTKRVNSFRPIREKEFSNLCRWIASQSGSMINLTEKVIVTNYDIITLSALGKKTNEQAKFVSIVKGIIALASGFSIADVFPSVKLIGKISGLRKKIEGLHHEAEKIILKIIDEQKLNNNINNSDYDHVEGKKQEDLLDVLLKLQDAGLELPLTIKNIVPVLQDMLIGGVETSATTTDWAMAELLRNPSVLKKAQDEVRHVFDGKTQHVVDESYFDELKYLKLVIKETLRMHPPLPLLLPRECRERCTIDGYDIPEKTRVLVNAWAINRDPNHWKDPDSFEPDRFLDNNDVDYKGNDFHYIPFGAGRRICPGVSFGLANVELPLAMFLYHFDWILPGGIKPDMAEEFGATVKRKSDLYVIPLVRRPLPQFESKE